MTLNRMTAIAVAGMIVTTATAYAAPLGVAGPQMMNPGLQIEQVYCRDCAIPGEIVGGLVAGVVGGAIAGGCYFNDCYDDSDGGYYGGHYGGHAGYGAHGRLSGHGRTYTR